VKPIDVDAPSARAFVAVAYRRDADADVADVTTAAIGVVA